jgi:uncharacterized protein (DUF2236 family)
VDRPSPPHDADDDEALLARAGLAELPPPEQGLFADDSWIRRVSGESALLFGGGRALLLEVAHPLVAAGVARHSSFRTDPFGRLQRTLDAMSKLTFGDRAAALAAARFVERAHGRVHGVLGHAVGCFGPDTRYDGRDPELVRWVWATLVDTSLLVYEELVEPLDAAARESFFAGQRVLARLLGVPEDRVPAGYDAFRRYFDGMLAGDELVVGDEAREIAQAVLHPAAVPGAGRVRLLTAALLPERLRREFGLPWDAERAARYEGLRESVRRLRREARRDGDGADPGARRGADLR